MGRGQRSGTVRPSSQRPIPPRRPGRSRDRTGEAGSSLTPAGPQTRGEWEDKIADLTSRMLVIERKNRELAQAVAAQDSLLEGYRRGCTQIVEKITSLDAYAQAVDKRINQVDNLIHNEMTLGRDQLRELERVVSEMRGGVAGPDNFNIGLRRGGGHLPVAATYRTMFARTPTYTLLHIRDDKPGSKLLKLGNKQTPATLTGRVLRHSNRCSHLLRSETNRERPKFITCSTVASRLSRSTARAPRA